MQRWSEGGWSGFIPKEEQLQPRLSSGSISEDPDTSIHQCQRPSVKSIMPRESSRREYSEPPFGLKFMDDLVKRSSWVIIQVRNGSSICNQHESPIILSLQVPFSQSRIEIYATTLINEFVQVLVLFLEDEHDWPTRAPRSFVNFGQFGLEVSLYDFRIVHYKFYNDYDH